MKQKIAIDHLNLTVHNFKESLDWYQKVFQFELVEEGIDSDGPWGILRNEGSMLCIYESPMRKPLRDTAESDRYHQIFHFGIKVENREEWVNTVKTHSIRTYYGSPVHYPHSQSWYVKDPTGHMIEVSVWDQNKIQF